MKILVANRGEIAMRILRTCRDLGIPSVAVYSDADRESLHTRFADEAVHIGPTLAAKSYLNINAIIKAAKSSGADAVHPGYGFLSENAEFARVVEAAGLTFIGPRPETIALLGDKLSARKAARKAGVPVLPGSDKPIQGDISWQDAKQVKYPVLVKAAAGGGGRGIRLAQSPEELQEVVSAAQEEAQAAFGESDIFLESLVRSARHIEVQILGDGKGQVFCLGDRECSIQRRRQKLIEESPAYRLSDAQRKFIHQAAIRLGSSLKYRSLGTVEFLLDKEGLFHFIEVNPRIQVEHTVTEMVSGIDLVKEQLRLTAGRPLKSLNERVSERGAAIEARILAEDPSQGFLPTTGKITYLKEPGGAGIRVDSALYQGMEITADYDSLLAKVIAWGENRAMAILRLRRALQEFKIGGLTTDLEFLLQVLTSHTFLAGNVDTTYLDTFSPSVEDGDTQAKQEAAIVTALWTHNQNQKKRTKANLVASSSDSWRMTAWKEQMRGS